MSLRASSRSRFNLRTRFGGNDFLDNVALVVGVCATRSIHRSTRLADLLRLAEWPEGEKTERGSRRRKKTPIAVQ